MKYITYLSVTALLLDDTNPGKMVLLKFQGALKLFVKMQILWVHENSQTLVLAQLSGGEPFNLHF